MKIQVDDLAVFGGQPAFVDALHVGRPNIGDRSKFEERVSDILDRKWFTNNGSYVREFERKVADTVGVAHCIAMCNATVALEIAVRALGLSGEVIIPSFTFVATAHALQWQEITPVFCDVEPRTFCLDPDKVEQMITPRTSGIIGVHVYGRACNVDALSEIAHRRNLKLLFDSAHAFGCSYNGHMIGSFGDAEVFSFHATKFINSLEGGAVVTNDDGLADRIRLMKNFGFTGYDRAEYIGINGKMNELSAAMGLTNLESMQEFISVNYRNYKLYQEKLANIDGISVVSYNEGEKCNYQYVVIEIDQLKTIISRDDLMKILHAENILARRYFYPGCHQMEPYRSHFPNARLLLPETEKLTQRVLCLPTGMSSGEIEIDIICRIIHFVVENSIDVKNKLMQKG
jgi:dTDP-4-amino-4,6-dideoxygalactose transaminase